MGGMALQLSSSTETCLWALEMWLVESTALEGDNVQILPILYSSDEAFGFYMTCRRSHGQDLNYKNTLILIILVTELEFAVSMRGRMYSG